MKTNSEIEIAKLNLETAQIAWTGLQRFFAQGSVIWIDPSLDLIEVAYRLSEDDSDVVKQWMKDSLVAPVKDEQAKHWLANDSYLWSVVVRPLVLVQDINSGFSP